MALRTRTPAQTTDAPRILVVDDHPLFREGVRWLLAAQTDWRIDEASTGAEAIQLMRDEPWDAVLLDVLLPDRTAFDILRQVRPRKPDLPILILSAYPERQYAVTLLRAGASGYVSKDAGSDEVVQALRAIMEGRKYISDDVAQMLAADLSGPPRAPHMDLSQREFQVFHKLASGKSLTDIARELHLSEKTVSTYRARIFEKMHFSSVSDLAGYAVKNNLLP